MVWAYGISKLTELGLEKLQDFIGSHTEEIPLHVKESIQSKFPFVHLTDSEKTFQGQHLLARQYGKYLDEYRILAPRTARLIPGAVIHEHAHLASGWQRKYLKALEESPILKAIHYATRRPELLGVIGGLIPGPWGLAFTALGYTPHFLANTEANLRGMVWLLTNKSPYNFLSKSQKQLALAHLGLQQLKTYARLGAALGLAVAIKKALERRNDAK